MALTSSVTFFSLKLPEEVASLYFSGQPDERKKPPHEVSMTTLMVLPFSLDKN